VGTAATDQPVDDELIQDITKRPERYFQQEVLNTWKNSTYRPLTGLKCAVILAESVTIDTVRFHIKGRETN